MLFVSELPLFVRLRGSLTYKDALELLGLKRRSKA